MSRLSSTIRASGFVTGALLLLAAIAPQGLSYGDGTPEIEDAFGDVGLSQANLRTLMGANTPESLPGGATDAFDLRSAYVGLEAQDAFSLDLHVQGMPAYWELPSRGASSLASDAEAAGVTWKDANFEDAITYTAYFTIRGHAYHATASLAEVQIPADDAGLATAQGYVGSAKEALTSVRQLVQGYVGLPSEAGQALDDAQRNVDHLYATLLTCTNSDCNPVDLMKALRDAQSSAQQAASDVEKAINDLGVREAFEAAQADLEAAANGLPATINAAVAGANAKLAETMGMLNDQVLQLQSKVAKARTDTEALIHSKADPLKSDAEKSLGDVIVAATLLQDFVDEQAADLPAWTHATIQGYLDVILEQAGLSRSDLGLPQITPGGDVAAGGKKIVFAGPTDALAPLQAAKDAADGLHLLTAGSLAVLSQPGFQSAHMKTLVFDRYSLVNEETKAAQAIGGDINIETATVQFFLLKSQVGSPVKGDWLADFSVETSIHGTVVDFAPEDARDHSYQFRAEPATAGRPDETQGTEGTTTNSGNQGTTGGSGGSGGPGSGGDPAPLPVSDVKVEVGGTTDRLVQAGGVATYVISLANPGTGASKGLISLSPAAPGWTQQVSATQWDLAPGATKEITVVVSALKGGDSEQKTRVFLSPEGGQTTVKEFHTSLASPAVKHQAKAFPWLLAGGLVALLALAGAAVGIVLHRRR